MKFQSHKSQKTILKASASNDQVTSEGLAIRLALNSQHNEGMGRRKEW